MSLWKKITNIKRKKKMADIIKKATNKFTKGLVMDFSPENTKNEVLTHALNATLLTFNGNELSLQNDMGNARVESAYLPEGYIPVGTCEYGGIIYIVSYNPLEDKSQIGCFPSPERNISSDELGISDRSVTRDSFQKFNKENPTGEIANTSQCVLLRNDKLNPGDKFIVSTSESIYDEAIQDLFIKIKDGKYNPVEHPRIALNVVSIEDSGKIVYLNSDIRQYEVQKEDVAYKYHLLGNLGLKDTQEDKKQDIDKYRNVLSSGYSVFKSKTSGKLAILAELITIDSFSITHGLQPRLNEYGKVIEGRYDVVIYSDVTPEVTDANYYTVPKLKYYYLQHSQGHLQVFNTSAVCEDREMFVEKGNSYMLDNSDRFLQVPLSSIYSPTVPGVSFKETLGFSSKFNFPKPKSYHGRMVDVGKDISKAEFVKLTEDMFHRVAYSQLHPTNGDDKNDATYLYFRNDLQVKIYYYDKSEKAYDKYTESELKSEYTYYTKKSEPIYKKAEPSISRDIELYKIVSSETIASEKVINDPSIMKYQRRETVVYEEASEEQILKHEVTLWIQTSETSWEEVTTPVPGNEYFIKISTKNLVEIGTEINVNDYVGDIFYYPTTKNYTVASNAEKNLLYSGDTSITLYYISNYEDVYTEATVLELSNYDPENSELYYNTEYHLIDPLDSFGGYKTYQLFIVAPMDVYVPVDKLKPDPNKNYINGYDKPAGDYPKDAPMYLYALADFMPAKTDDTHYTYSDVILAGIKFPNETLLYNVDLPFKYDYTIVPCMDYGRLDSLAVSNTVDFSKLHLFDQSNFTTWKYHIDGNQLRLTFGAEIYDTYEIDKVDGLILEFYDMWGFAGSLEISNKRAYSGVFTKIIPLNTLNALSKKKITGKETFELYRRNANIKPQLDENDPENIEFKGIFNEREVYKIDDIQGWGYTDTRAPLTESESDCGVLFSNLVYGVKTYLKMLKNDGSVDYIPKKELFLFTIPLYNDYYYTLDDFNLIENPELDMVLTYKLVDNGQKSVYDQGYNNYNDRVLISNYLEGSYTGTNLEVTKYYKYSGITDLYLEVGLKKDYSDVGIGYSPEVNKYFSCDLQLMSDEYEDKSLSVKSLNSTEDTPEQILNYGKVGDIEESEPAEQAEDGETSEENSAGISYTQYSFDLNRLGFGNTYERVKNIPSLAGYNFLNTLSEYNIPIPIYYMFVVGYKVNINDIKTSKIPMPTLCALYHKNDNGITNDYDFGIYTSDSDGTIKYLSDVVLYNAGDEKEERFGICKQTNPDGDTIEKQCFSVNEVVTPTTITTTAGKLNSGNPLTQIKSYIGKLMFGQPHIHGFGDGYRSNISGGCIITNGDKIQENKWSNYYLSANTKSSIDYSGEFISLVAGTCSGGLSAFKLTDYNEKLLTTMSDVYAYNPDYDTFDIKVGNVEIQNKQIQFISNLLSRNAKFNFPSGTSLNDFIYIGPTYFSVYLDYLHKHSNIKTDVKQVIFTPNYTYCGKTTEAYLVSSLTYNAPIPTEIVEELSFQSSNLFAVRKHDGTKIILEGAPDKKTLYGLYEKNTVHKVFNLDVSNYKINKFGKLTVLNTYNLKETGVIYLPISDVLGKFRDGINVPYPVIETFQGTNLRNFEYSSDFKLFLSGVEETDKCFFDPSNNRILLIVKKVDGCDSIQVSIYPTIPATSNNPSFDPRVYNTSNKQVSASNVGMSVEINSKIVRKKIVVGTTEILLNSQTIQNLHQIAMSEPSTLTHVVRSAGGKLGSTTTYTYSSNTFWDSDQSKISVMEGGKAPFMASFGEAIKIDVSEVSKDKFILCSITINQMLSNITVSGRIEDVKTSIITSPITPAKNYVVIDADNYLVKAPSINTMVNIQHTSITLNDLQYEPSIDGHRLYLKRTNQWASLTTHPIYYRGKGGKVNTDNENYNKLIPYRGPAFINV